MRSKVLVAAAVCVTLAFPILAQHEHPQITPEQQKMMEAYARAATPGEAHKVLEPMVGTWDAVVRWWAAPGAPPQESKGVSESRWIFGGRYIEQRFKGAAMGEPFEGVGYTGYDNIKKQYFGTWMDSMSTGIMMTSGSTADGGKTWTFTGTMDDPLTGKTFPVEEKVTVVSADRHVFEMWNPAPDGTMFRSMEITYTRKK